MLTIINRDFFDIEKTEHSQTIIPNMNILGYDKSEKKPLPIVSLRYDKRPMVSKRGRTIEKYLREFKTAETLSHLSEFKTTLNMKDNPRKVEITFSDDDGSDRDLILAAIPYNGVLEPPAFISDIETDADGRILKAATLSSKERYTIEYNNRKYSKILYILLENTNAISRKLILPVYSYSPYRNKFKDFDENVWNCEKYTIKTDRVCSELTYSHTIEKIEKSKVLELKDKKIQLSPVDESDILQDAIVFSEYRRNITEPKEE